MVSIMVSKTIDVGSIPAAPAKSPQTRLGFFLAKFIQQLKHKVVASVPQENHLHLNVIMVALPQANYCSGRLPPPVFTGAAPLPLGSLPAGLPTQLIRLWQGTQ